MPADSTAAASDPRRSFQFFPLAWLKTYLLLTCQGRELKIAFNARYLLDALNATRAKEIYLGFQDPLSPARIIPTDDDDALAVVMPMRV